MSFLIPLLKVAVSEKMVNFADLKNKVKEMYYKWSKNKWLHVKRVLAFATIISKKMKLSKKDIQIIQLAALLHDIGYIKQPRTRGKDIHEEHSCEIARELLESYGVDKETIEKVISAILTHTDFDACTTIYQKVIYDADKLDKTTIGEVIRKSIICYEKYHMDEYETFKNLYRRLGERKFHLKVSKDIAFKNKRALLPAYRNYDKFLKFADELESSLTFNLL
jgi:putative nucleotidyltransferase with HDIG domain